MTTKEPPEMIYGLYLPYHKSQFMDMSDETYDATPDFPVEFRRVRMYKRKTDCLDAYANTMCPDSQMFECINDKEVFDAKVAELDKQWCTKKEVYFSSKAKKMREDIEAIENTVVNQNIKTIDWEQRRYEIAKEAIWLWIANRPAPSYRCAAENAVELADILIEELQKSRR